jgi:hypothetical protein
MRLIRVGAPKHKAEKYVIYGTSESFDDFVDALQRGRELGHGTRIVRASDGALLAYFQTYGRGKVEGLGKPALPPKPKPVLQSDDVRSGRRGQNGVHRSVRRSQLN